tara:strand:- start:10197 stop:10352 length:156 start_codon:yes stop_codon:yes gene_type:complete
MEYATHIIAWLAMLTYIASTGFDVWEKYRRYKNVQQLEQDSSHIFFGDGLE